MSKQIVAAEIHQDNLPEYIRMNMAYDERQIRSYLAHLNTHMDEVFILSSGNRFAVYGIHKDITPLVKFFSNHKEIAPYVTYYSNTEESIHHFFATAGRLCSYSTHDVHILTHIRHAYKSGLESQTVGLIFDNLLREGIRVGERILRETRTDAITASTLCTGFSLLETCFPHPYNKVILIIGTGKTAKLALDKLYYQNAPNVFLAGTNQERCYELANRYNAHHASMRTIHRYFSMADVIIIDDDAVNELSNTVSRTDLSKKRIVLNFGKGNRLNILKEHPDIELYNLEDLQAIRPAAEKIGGLGEAWEIVMEETQNFVGILKQLEISPIQAAYWNKIIDIKTQELDWMLPRLGDVSECNKELIKKYTCKLIRTTQKPRTDESPEAIKHLYKLYNINLNISSN